MDNMRYGDDLCCFLRGDFVREVKREIFLGIWRYRQQDRCISEYGRM